MPITRESRLNACKATYFNPDPKAENPFRNAGSAAVAITQSFFAPEDVDLLYRHHETTQADKGTNVEILRGSDGTSKEAAGFGGSCAMAQWLLRARYPQVRYADFMDGQKYAAQKRQVGHEVAVALDAYLTTGNHDAVASMTAECMKAYSQMDMRQELSYALGLYDQNPTAEPSQQQLRDAMTQNPVRSSQLIDSIMTHNQNSEQMFSGFDRGSTSFSIPPRANDKPTKVAIRNALTAEQLDAYCKKTAEIKGFAPLRRLRDAMEDHNFVAMQQSYERQLDRLAQSGDQPKQPTPWERKLDESMVYDNEVVNTHTHALFESARNKDLLHGGNVSEADLRSLSNSKSGYMLSRTDTFAGLASIYMLDQPGATIDNLVHMDGTDPAAQRGAAQAFSDVQAVENGDVEKVADMARRLNQFKQAVLAHEMREQRLNTNYDILAALDGVSLVCNALDAAVTMADGMARAGNQETTTARRSELSVESQEELRGLRGSYRALSAIMEKVTDTRLSTDERIIAKRTLEAVAPHLKEHPVGVDTEALLIAAEAEQRQQVKQDTDIIVEERAAAYLDGDIPYDQIRNEKQVFRSLAQLEDKTTLDGYLSTSNPKMLYALGHDPKHMTAEMERAGVSAFDQQFAHLERDHQQKAYKATGFESPTSTFFIDGKSVQEYAKQQGIPCQGVDKEKATIMAAIASGEHHVEVGTLGMDKSGNFGVNVSTVKMDLSALDGQESFFSRKASGKAERMHHSDSQQAQRQSDIKGRLQSEFASGMNREINRRDREQYQKEKMSMKDLPVAPNQETQQAAKSTTIAQPVAQKAPVASAPSVKGH